MTLTKMNGKTNVGEVRLAPLDMGFDVKEVDITVHLPDDFWLGGIREGWGCLPRHGDAGRTGCGVDPCRLSYRGYSKVT